MATILRNAFDLLAHRVTSEIEPYGPEAAALSAVRGVPISVRAHADIVPVASRNDYVHVVADGMACRFGLVADGRRQITAVHVAGDPCGLEIIEGRPSTGLHALTNTVVLRLPRRELAALAGQFASLAKAFWRICALDALATAQWLINIGRREARSRMAHFLCEMGLRLEHAGRARRDCFRLGMTQAQLSDVLGLTPVHVNRVLQALRREEVLHTAGAMVTITDWDELVRIADFDPSYLQLDERRRSRPDADPGLEQGVRILS